LRWAVPNEEQRLIKELAEEGGERMGATFSEREAVLLASFKLENKHQVEDFLWRHSEKFRVRYYNRLAQRLQQARARTTSRLPKRQKKSGEKDLSLFQKLEIWWALRPLLAAYEIAKRENREAQEFVQVASQRRLQIACAWLLQELRFAQSKLKAQGYHPQL